jgi:hypothetical protein
VRFGYVMAGLGAACAFGVVSNRVTVLGTRIGGHYELSSQQEERRTPGVDLAARDSGDELIDIGLRLDQLDVLPGQIGPFTSFFAPGGPPPPRWAPFQTQQSGLAFGGEGSSVGDLVVAGGGAAGVIAQAQTLPPTVNPPADPPPDAPPPPAALGGLGQSPDPVLFLPPGPGQPAPGGPPPPGGVDPGPVLTPTTGPPPPPPPPGPPLPSPPLTPVVLPGVADPTPPAFAAPPGGPGGPAGAPGPVPEPAAWSAMLIGFGLAGHALRRRRKAREYAC